MDNNNINKKNTGNGNNKVNLPKFNLNWLYMILLMMLAGLWLTNKNGVSSKNVSYDEFQSYVQKGYISRVTGFDDNSVEAYIKPQHVGNVFGIDSTRVGRNPMVTTEAPSRESLGDFLQKEKDENHFDGAITYEKKGNYMSLILWNVVPILLVVGFWIYLSRRWSSGGGMGGGGGIFNVGKSKAQLFEKGSNIRVTFKDVAGLAEAKQEVEEIVEFLKEPQKYTDLGGKIPKGALLVGPPGTGKTLLARACAGEAGVPFYSISGSDFVEMYVGVGASRVRDLFDKAKKSMPCIIFIDEIDAVGRQRGAGLGGGHDEREQTLNQLLVEMDGFEANDGIIVMAATNRADILDKALLRPGRFDRQVYVGLPDVKGREEILKVHTKKKPLAPDVSLRVIAQRTAGFAGADLENLVNEAALLAARRNRKAITMEDIEEASMKVMAGPEKKSRVVTPEEKKLTAYHEAGHAVAGFYCKHHPRVHEITIIPRGQAGGYTMYLPEKDRSYVTKGEMFEDIVSSLGGRVAEQLILEDISTGASNDLQQATNIARQMITKYGFSERLGPVVYGTSQEETFLGRDLGQGKGYSETTAAEIDGEMRDIIDEAYETCRRTLTEHIDQLHALAKALMEREKLNEQEFNTIMAGGTLPPREGDEQEQTVQAAPAETAEQAQPAEAAEPAEQAETAQPLPETAAPEAPDAQDPQN